MGGARRRRGARVLRVPARARHQPDDDPAVVAGARRSPSSIRSSSASSSLPQAFLGIAFSFGIPMAYAAVYGSRSADRVVASVAQPLLGRSPTTPSTRWSIATTTCGSGCATSAIAFGRFDVARGRCSATRSISAEWLRSGAFCGWGRSTTPALPWRSAAPRFTGTSIRQRERASLLRGVPAQSLARLRRLRRHRARLRRAPVARGRARCDDGDRRGTRRVRTCASCDRKLRAAAGALPRRARADPRQLSGRGVARRASSTTRIRAITSGRWSAAVIGAPLRDMPYRAAARARCAPAASGSGTRSSRASGGAASTARSAMPTRGEIERVRRARAVARARLLQRPDRGARASDVARRRLRDARAAVVVAGAYATVRAKSSPRGSAIGDFLQQSGTSSR